MEIEAHVEYVARSLERRIEARPLNGNPRSETQELRKRVGILDWRIEQTCPVCDVIIGVTFRETEISGPDWLFAQIFGLYDEHRCRIASDGLDAARVRAESESERLAKRAAVIREREANEPPHELPSLYERAERESVVLAEWANGFARR